MLEALQVENKGPKTRENGVCCFSIRAIYFLIKFNSREVE